MVVAALVALGTAFAAATRLPRGAANSLCAIRFVVWCAADSG